MPRSLNSDRQIILVAHDIRSAHNVGSLFRTAEGLGVNQLILSGYTPYPRIENDDRLEHLVSKLDKQIDKTALGAQNSLKWRHIDDIYGEIAELRKLGFKIYGLEQHKSSVNIMNVKPDNKIVVIAGNEVTGLDEELISKCDQAIEIPMLGKKESFNVVQASAMAIFYLRFY